MSGIHMVCPVITQLATVQLTNQSWNNSIVVPGSNTGVLTWLDIFSDGTYICYYGATPSGPSNQIYFSGNWYSPTTVGIGSSYWVRATNTSGSAPTTGSDSLNTWLSMSSTRRWNNNKTSGIGVQTCQVTIEISSSASGTPLLATGVFTMMVEISN